VLGFLRALAALPAGLWLGAILLLVAYVLWRFVVRRRAMRALDVPRLPVAELRAGMQSAAPPLVIDVRGAMQQMIEQRIPGAISIALEELERFPLEQLAGRGAVLYCTCPNEASAAAGVRILRARGHANARALRGGLAAWIEAGYETDARAAPRLQAILPAASS